MKQHSPPAASSCALTVTAWMYEPPVVESKDSVLQQDSSLPASDAGVEIVSPEHITENGDVKAEPPLLQPPPQLQQEKTRSLCESFQTSSISEAEQIVHVYSLLESLGGVFGDGKVEGVELTRDGRALAYQSSDQGRQQWEQRLNFARHGDKKSIQALSSSPDLEVDRYGFFTQIHSLRSSTASNDARTWLLEKSAFVNSTTTPSTSAIPKRASLAATNPPGHEEVVLETSRMNKWQKMLLHDGPAGQERRWTFTPETLNSARRRRKVNLLKTCAVLELMPLLYYQLRRRIYKGVPDRWRPAVWPLLSTLTPSFGAMPSTVLNSWFFSFIQIL